MKIHDTLYMPRKCMDGGDEDVFLFICWNNLIHYISKTLSKKYLMNVIEKKQIPEWHLHFSDVVMVNIEKDVSIVHIMWT